MSKPKILFYPNTGYKAQFFLRMLWPAEQLALNGYEVQVKDPRSVGEWNPHFMLKDFTNADIIVTHQPKNKSDMTMFEAVKMLDKKLVVDSDDYALGVDVSNPAYGAVGMKPVDGLWHEGVQLNSDAAYKRHVNMLKIMRDSDACSYTTDTLAGLYDSFVPKDEVYVLPNSLKLSHYKKWERRAPEDRVNIVWQGGGSHTADLDLILKPLYDITKKYPQVKVITFGDNHPDLESALGDRAEHHSWVESDTFYVKIGSLDADINLCPLVDTMFNKGKSNLKMLEAGVFGVPSICSGTPHGPYNARDDCDDRILVANKPEAWFGAMERLIVNEELRRTMGDRAREFTEAVYNIEHNWKYWAECFDTLHKRLVD